LFGPQKFVVASDSLKKRVAALEAEVAMLR
jgi:hypothetical protein